MAEWSPHQTHNPAVPGSDHNLELFHGSPKFESSAMPVNSQWDSYRCYVQFELFVSVVARSH